MEEKILEFRNSLNPEHRDIFDESIDYKEDVFFRNNDKLAFKTITLNKIDGELFGETKKVLNILKIDFKKMSKLLIAYGTISQINENVSLIFGILQFVYEIDDQLEIKFSEREARVLLSIYSLVEVFTCLEVKSRYLELFGVQLEEFQLQISLDKLEKLKCISKENRTNYKLIEKIIYKEG